MSVGKVPSRFFSLENNSIRSAAVPSAADWQAMALNSNYILGHGTQLVPFVYFSGTEGYMAPNREYTYQITMFPNAQNLDRYLVFSVRSSGAIGLGGLRVKSNENMPMSYSIGPDPYQAVYRMPLSQSANTTTVLGLSMSTNVTASILCLGIWEAPRAFLMTTSVDLGLNEDTFRVRYPIYEDTRGYESVYALASRVSSSFSANRKSGVWAYISPLRVTGTFESNASFKEGAGTVTAFSTLSAAISFRPTYAYSQTASADFVALVRGDNALTSGTLYLETKAGKYSVNFRCGINAVWVSGTVNALTDGVTGSALPAGGLDMLGIKLQRSGSGNVYVHSMLIGERAKGI